jgi:hypothetical protein
MSLILPNGKRGKLEVGRYYVHRDGTVVGPMERNPDRESLYPFGVKPFNDNRTWTSAGRFHHVGSDSRDIVAECPQNQDVHTEKKDGAESELERLVQIANEGRATAIKLDQFSGLIEHYDGTYFAPASTKSIRIKPPKPAFSELTVGNNWKVRLDADGTTLHVGCKQFDAELLRDALPDLCEAKEGGDWTLSGFSLRPKRNGIHMARWTLSWPGADLLLAALETYFKAKEAA